MKSSSLSLSPALLQANKRLHDLRKQTKLKRAEPGHSEKQRPSMDQPPWDEVETTEIGLTAVEPVKKLPPHLGWGGEAATKAIRVAIRKKEQEPASTERLKADHLPFRPISDKSHQHGQPSDSQSSETAGQQLSLPLYKETIKHYPDIGIAALKKEQAVHYRVWLMCRYLDRQGRGWWSIQDIREQLTSKESKLRLFGWRRLRQILGRGHGRFWNWDKENGRVWLFGAEKVAANLEVPRLTGKPVLLPVTAVASSIGEFKAHLYAAWHSGRKRNNPISRKVQENIIGIPERTQRHYCQVGKIRRQTNIAIGSKYTREEALKQTWQRGQAVFQFVDHHGKLGQKGISYIAWHLPNSYTGPHRQTTKGRMRKISQKLVDLVTKGARGNDRKKVGKMYHVNGAEAGRALNWGKAGETYWPMVAQSRRSHLWAVFSLA